jgi:vesicle coat complex subunit
MIAELYKLASSIATALTEYVVTPILDALKWLFDKISSLVSSSISQVLNFLREKAPITPEKAWDLLPYVVGLGCSWSIRRWSILHCAKHTSCWIWLKSRPFGEIY